MRRDVVWGGICPGMLAAGRVELQFLLYTKSHPIEIYGRVQQAGTGVESGGGGGGGGECVPRGEEVRKGHPQIRIRLFII